MNSRPSAKAVGSDRRAAIALFAIAFAMRLAFVFETTDLPQFRTPRPGLDVDLHWRAAQVLGGPAERGTFLLALPSAPAFTAVLHLSQSIFGVSLTLHRILFAAFGSAGVAFLYVVMRRSYIATLPALIAGGLAALLPSLVYFDTAISKVTLEILLQAMLLALLLSLRRTDGAPTLRRAGVAGLLLGLLVSLQRAYILFVAFPLLWILLFAQRSSRLRRRAALTAVLGLGLAWLADAALARAAGDNAYWPVSGIHARVGFHDGATGTYSNLPGVPGFPFGHAFAGRMLAEVEACRPLTPAEANRHHWAKAVDFVRRNPQQTARIVAAKLGYFFADFELKGNDYLEFLRTQSMALRLPLGFGCIVFLATAGGIGLVRERRWGLLLLLGGCLGAVLAANLITFVTWRYRLPAVVPLLVLAGHGLDRGVAFLRGAWEQRRVAQLLHAVVLVSVAVPSFAYVQRQLEPSAEVKQRMMRKARAIAEKCLVAERIHRDLDEDGGVVPIGLRIAGLRRLHRHEEAFALVRGEVQAGWDPRAATAYLEYLAWLGRPEEALHTVSELRNRAPAGVSDPIRRSPDLLRRWLTQVVLKTESCETWEARGGRDAHTPTTAIRARPAGHD